MTLKTGVLICGAGIVGLTLARELIRRGASDILLLEKEERLGAHASGRNSGVLHAGVYYAPGTERAKTCLEGNKRMRAYCRERGLPLFESGKVIVASAPEQIETLRELHRRATANGAQTRVIDAKELAELEPNAATVECALHSPLTAVTDPRRVLESLAAELQATGKAKILFNTRFVSAGIGRRVSATAGDIEYEYFVNAAGAYSDRVAHAFGLGREYRLLPFKGIYRKLKKECSDFVRGSIYPAPNLRNPFLGVHFTRSVHGEVYLGPTAIPAFGRENYGFFQGLDAEAPVILAREAKLFFINPAFRSAALEEPRKYRFSAFFRDAAKLAPGLDPACVEPSPKVGIRPQLVDMRNGQLVMDFLLLRDERSLHSLNAISPAFTSSLAFAETLADAVETPL
jgi:L-2-hydroxyglutarate oxidase LhgO